MRFWCSCTTARVPGVSTRVTSPQIGIGEQELKILDTVGAAQGLEVVALQGVQERRG